MTRIPPTWWKSFRVWIHINGNQHVRLSNYIYDVIHIMYKLSQYRRLNFMTYIILLVYSFSDVRSSEWNKNCPPLNIIHRTWIYVLLKYEEFKLCRNITKLIKYFKFYIQISRLQWFSITNCFLIINLRRAIFHFTWLA